LTNTMRKPGWSMISFKVRYCSIVFSSEHRITRGFGLTLLAGISISILIQSRTDTRGSQTRSLSPGFETYRFVERPHSGERPRCVLKGILPTP
jgi:hypothetical protein